jgi:protein-disulfide isomerase
VKRVVSSVLVAVAAITLSACASRADVEALKKEVEALKASQAQLARQVSGARPQQQQQARALPASMDLSGTPFVGSATATVALVEYSDYECPFCIRHFTQVMPQIKQAYIDTNKVRYMFRDFPIDELHPQAIRGHVAAHCANEQGKFWEMHNRLFTKAGTHTPDQLAARAAEIGLNPSAFNACMSAEKYTAGIRQSTAYAISLGASGTPFFVVGKFDPKTNQLTPLKAIPGAFPFAQFQAAIDAALAGTPGK